MADICVWMVEQQHTVRHRSLYHMMFSKYRLHIVNTILTVYIETAACATHKRTYSNKHTHTHDRKDVDDRESAVVTTTTNVMFALHSHVNHLSHIEQEWSCGLSTFTPHAQ